MGKIINKSTNWEISWLKDRVAKNDKPYFVLKAANHQEIGRSQYYSSQAAAEKGVESVINNASSAVIKEVSE